MELKFRNIKINIEKGDVFKDIKHVGVAKESDQLEGDYKEVERKEDLMQLSIVEIKEIRSENSEDDNSKSVVEKWERHFNFQCLRHLLEDV